MMGGVRSCGPSLSRELYRGEGTLHARLKPHRGDWLNPRSPYDMPVISAPDSLRQESHEFEADLR